jgi:hypothetical protein
MRTLEQLFAELGVSSADRVSIATQFGERSHGRRRTDGRTPVAHGRHVELAITPEEAALLRTHGARDYERPLPAAPSLPIPRPPKPDRR